MSKKTTAARVHDARLIEKVADAHDARRAAALTAANPMVRASRKLQAENAERTALNDIARKVEVAKRVGYSQEAAEGLIGQGEARAYARHAMVNGAVARTDAPKGEIKVKSDGSRDRLIDAARRRYGRETERPADHWDGTEGYQQASLKDDAADTDEWFG